MRTFSSLVLKMVLIFALFVVSTVAAADFIIFGGSGGGGGGSLTNDTASASGGQAGSIGGAGGTSTGNKSGGGGAGYSANDDGGKSGGQASTYSATMKYREYNSVSVEGGHGGHGGTSSEPQQLWTGGGGGAGGGVLALVGKSLLVRGDLSVLAGDGGGGGSGGAQSFGDRGGIGGDGGRAELDAAGKRVEVRGALTVTSGANGTNGLSLGSGGGAGGLGGAGGDAVFTAGVLVAPDIRLSRPRTIQPNGNWANGGALTFRVDRLDVVQDTSLFLENTDIWDSATSTGVLVSGLRFANASTLTVTQDSTSPGRMTGAGFLIATGRGNVYNSPFAYDVSGSTLSFVMDRSESVGDTMITTTGSGGITIDDATTLAMSGSTSFIAGDSLVLAEGLSASPDASQLGQHYVVRRLFDVTYAANSLLAQVLDVESFSDTLDRMLSSGLYNANLQRGVEYLDGLETQLGLSNPVMEKLDVAFDAAINPELGGWGQRVGLGQLFGEYAAYAGTALSSDMARFRSRWQSRNRSFLDAGLFADASSVASASGLASPLYGARETVARGRSRIWAGGFGNWANQKSKNGFAGYKYDSVGAMLGYEYSLDCLNLGFAAAYTRGDLKVTDLRYKNEADILNLALYGTWLHQSGLYAEAGLGYGHAWNDYTVDSIATPGGRKTAKYGSDAFSANAELGYIARLPKDFALIPSLGLNYTYSRNKAWTEGVNSSALAANRFGSTHDHGVDMPVGLRFNRLFRFGLNGGYVVPEVRTSFVYAANTSRPAITSGFAGAPGSARMAGAGPGRSHWRIGAGLSGRVNNRMDFRLDYDFQTRSRFRDHTVNGSVGLAF